MQNIIMINNKIYFFVVNYRLIKLLVIIAMMDVNCAMIHKVVISVMMVIFLLIILVNVI